jgi:hypothetical protein
MAQKSIPTIRKTVTLPESVWSEINEYRHQHRILTLTEAVSRLIRAGMTVKVAVVGKTAKRKAL